MEPSVTPGPTPQGISSGQIIFYLAAIIIGIVILGLLFKIISNLISNKLIDQPEIKKKRRNWLLIDLVIWLVLSVFPLHIFFTESYCLLHRQCASDSLGNDIFGLFGLLATIVITIVILIVGLVHSQLGKYENTPTSTN